MQTYTKEDHLYQQQQQQYPKSTFHCQKITQELINNLKETQNPFSFYNSQRNQYNRSDSNHSNHNSDDQQQTQLQDITGVVSTHKIVCQAFSNKNIQNQNALILTPKKNQQFGTSISQQNTTSQKIIERQHTIQINNQNQNQVKVPLKLFNQRDVQSNLFQKQKISSIITENQQFKANTTNNQNTTNLNKSDIQSIQNISNIQVISLQAISNTPSNNVSLQLIGSQKQLDDDMNQLKLSFQQKNKKKQSKKQPLKADINKTMFNAPILATSNKKQTKTFNTTLTQTHIKQDAKIIYKFMATKKKQNFKALRDWDNIKNQSLDLHQEMIQHFVSEIDKRLKSSKQNFYIYYQFFKEKAQQQQKFANASLIDTKLSLKDNNVSKSLFINCTVVMNAINQQFLLKNKKVRDFAHLIRQNIIKDLMEKHISQSTKQLLILREKISTLKKTLAQCGQQVEATNQQLQKLFIEISNPPKDFYAAQIQYLRRSFRQAAIQKKMGLLSLQFHKKAIQQDIKRSQIIRQALITYSKGLKQTYNIDMQKQEIQQLSKGQQKKLIIEFYSFQQMFQDQMIKEFKKKSDMGFKKGDQVTFQHFEKYLQNYNIYNFDEKMATLKQFNTYYKAKDSKNQQSCYVVITIDGFLHFFINKDKKMGYSDSDISFPILKKGVDLKVLGGQSLQVIKKEQRKSSVISYFWDNGKNDLSYHLKFLKKNDKQDFIDIINKLIK